MSQIGWRMFRAALFIGSILWFVNPLLADEGSTYTLYRSSVVLEDARIHVATFDAKMSDAEEKYNRENCMLAARLFQQQPGVTVNFWCEKGRFHE